MAKKVTVFREEADSDDDRVIRALAATHEALRALRPLGIRFETVTVDGEAMTVSAWLEEREPKEKKERKALGVMGALPNNASTAGAE